MNVCHVCTDMHSGQKRELGTLEKELEVVSIRYDCWEVNKGLLEERDVLLTTDSPLRNPQLHFKLVHEFLVKLM